MCCAVSTVVAQKSRLLRLRAPGIPRRAVGVMGAQCLFDVSIFEEVKSTSGVAFQCEGKEERCRRLSIAGTHVIQWTGNGGISSSIGSEVGRVEPKVSPTGKLSFEFDVFALSRFAYASRDVRDVRGVPCVRRRARDRSIGRDRSEDPEIGLRLRRSGRIFLLLLLVVRTRLAF